MPNGGSIPVRLRTEATAGAMRPIPNKIGPKLNAKATHRIAAPPVFPVQAIPALPEGLGELSANRINLDCFSDAI